MRYKPWFALVLVFAIGHETVLAGGVRQLDLKWSELDSKVAHRKIALVLPGGTRIEGKALRVEPDGLRLKVNRTSDRKAQPKGEHLISRESVQRLRLTEYRAVGRLVGTLAPPAVVGLITPALSSGIYEGPLIIIVPAVAAAGAVGLAVAGYYIGKKLDTRVTEITIVRDSE